jgi:hypothetical protein
MVDFLKSVAGVQNSLKDVGSGGAAGWIARMESLTTSADFDSDIYTVTIANSGSTVYAVEGDRLYTRSMSTAHDASTVGARLGSGQNNMDGKQFVTVSSDGLYIAMSYTNGSTETFLVNEYTSPFPTTAIATDATQVFLETDSGGNSLIGVSNNGLYMYWTVGNILYYIALAGYWDFTGAGDPHNNGDGTVGHTLAVGRFAGGTGNGAARSVLDDTYLICDDKVLKYNTAGDFSAGFTEQLTASIMDFGGAATGKSTMNVTDDMVYTYGVSEEDVAKLKIQKL